MNLQGIYLPIITPMKGNSIDYLSYVNLLKHYMTKGIAGFIPLGTTGESPTIEAYEVEKLIDLTLETVDGQLPVYIGFGGNDTRGMLRKLPSYENKGIEGLLVASPYYNRPSQDGIIAHYSAIATSTDLDIILYNIPYRTGRNMTNDTIRTLSGHNNIVGLKDASGDMVQTTNLLLNRPSDFSILTGEDIHLLSALSLGADGGILASAHINTESYIQLFESVSNNDIQKARALWQQIAPIIPLLFKEPNPSPIKHLLMSSGLITSDTVRLPLTTISSNLCDELSQHLQTPL